MRLFECIESYVDWFTPGEIYPEQEGYLHDDDTKGFYGKDIQWLRINYLLSPTTEWLNAAGPLSRVMVFKEVTLEHYLKQL